MTGKIGNVFRTKLGTTKTYLSNVSKALSLLNNLMDR